MNDSETVDDSESQELREQIDGKKQRNRSQRIEFVKYWAKYVRDHEDREWSEQQNTLIDSQLKSD